MFFVGIYLVVAVSLACVVMAMGYIIWFRPKCSVAVLCDDSFEPGAVETAARHVIGSMIPFTPDAVVYCNTTKATILSDVQSLYKHTGIRVFVGPLTSGEILAAKPFLMDHPDDVVFISTGSTAVALELPDNVFRLSSPDSVYVQYLQSNIIPTLAGATKKLLVVPEPGDEWAAGLTSAILAAFPGRATRGTMGDIETSGDTLNIILYVHVSDMWNGLAAIKLPAFVLVGDIAFGLPVPPSCAHHTVWSAASFHAYTSIKAYAGITMCPTLTNMMHALWYAYDCVGSSRVKPLVPLKTYLQSAQGEELGNMFDDNGDALDADFALGIANKAGGWKIRELFGTHSLLGSKYTQFAH